MSRLAWSPRIWIWVFLFFNVVYVVPDNANGESRFALLYAMTETHSFSIDRYVANTIDWSRTPDGHYYSNKAPGPALVALPLFYVVDAAIVSGLTYARGLPRTPLRRDEIRREVKTLVFKTIAIGVQVIPLAVLMLYLLRDFRAAGVPLWQQHFAAAAILLGNTSSLFMNTYWGHGLAAVWVVALWLSVVRRRVFWVGLCYGWLILTDYGAAVFGLPLLWLVFTGETWAGTRYVVRARQLVAGGLLPGILWSTYHYACFGSIVTLPGRFQNPQFVSAQQQALWGMFSTYPDPAVLVQLLFGPYRGIAVTQPWVLLLLAVGIWTWPSFRKSRAFVFASMGLALLLGMNSAFNGWHGGDTPGPRYLSAVFPLFAIAVTEVGRECNSRRLQVSLWALLLASLVLFVAVYSTGLFAYQDRLVWSFYGQAILAYGTFGVRLKTIFALLVLAGVLYVIRRDLGRVEAAGRVPVAIL